MSASNSSGEYPQNLDLTSDQRMVIEALREYETSEYRLSQWYLGAMYALANSNNPDRFAQAAQSFRELLEKIPRVLRDSEAIGTHSGFRGMRHSIRQLLAREDRKPDQPWKGRVISAGLDKALRRIERYLELNAQPTRREQVYSGLSALDPMYGAFNRRVRDEKRMRYLQIWKALEGYAHHRPDVKESEFHSCLENINNLITELMAPISSRDQGEIDRILSKDGGPSEADIHRVLSLIERRGANYTFFFRKVDRTAWLVPLDRAGYFLEPPQIESAGDGRVAAPSWLPVIYLARIADRVPEPVVEVVCRMHDTENPRVLHEIVEIALKVPDVHLSLRLEKIVRKHVTSSFKWLLHGSIPKLMVRWAAGGDAGLKAALSLCSLIVAFTPDPRADEKERRRKSDPSDLFTSLEPSPRVESWEYQRILERGVKKLSAVSPFSTAQVLVDAAAKMINLMDSKVADGCERWDDWSESWCERIDHYTRPSPDSKVILIITITYACEQVYLKQTESIPLLDAALRRPRRKVFDRIRQHLYAKFPSDRTRPWIREFILDFDDYSENDLTYEFQRMVRVATEHFGDSLLSEDEQVRIFEAVLSGPSESAYRKFRGDEIADKFFPEVKRRFHLKQLSPFKALLYGEYRRYYDEIAEKEQSPADEDYMPAKFSGVKTGAHRSPKSIEELLEMSDKELVGFLNEWDDPHTDSEEWWIDIDFRGLGFALKEAVSRQPDRFAGWGESWREIERPVYFDGVLAAAEELVKNGSHEHLTEWFDLCDWILSHPEEGIAKGEKPSDTSRKHPSWHSARRAVVDFIETCLDEKSALAFVCRKRIYVPLARVCTELDQRLDSDRRIFPDSADLLSEAINNTRGRALQRLVDYGRWVRNHEDETAPVPEILGVLEKRFNEQPALTIPEYALLGVEAIRIYLFNPDWFRSKVGSFFPRTTPQAWRSAFGHFLQFCQAHRDFFNFIGPEFEFALDNIELLKRAEGERANYIDSLGEHLISYYFLDLVSLQGHGVSVEQYYAKTEEENWAHLFDHVGRLLSNSGPTIKTEIRDLVVEFFEYRLESGCGKELSEFTFWLEAECLDADWRVQAYLGILDVTHAPEYGMSLHV